MNQDKEKLKAWIAGEIATSNKNIRAMEPWERGFRASLEGLNRQIDAGTFDKEDKPHEL